MSESTSPLPVNHQRQVSQFSQNLPGNEVAENWSYDKVSTYFTEMESTERFQNRVKANPSEVVFGITSYDHIVRELGAARPASREPPNTKQQVTELDDRLTNLTNQMAGLQAVKADLQQRNGTLLLQVASVASQVTPAGSGAHFQAQSKRHPDSPNFNGDKAEFENWLGQMKTKLLQNADWSPNERSMVLYASSRLGKDGGGNA